MSRTFNRCRQALEKMVHKTPYIGIDVGSRRIGVAKSDPAARMAMPHETVAASHREAAAEQIAAMLAEGQSHTVVVGWPLTLEGTEGRATRNVARFIDCLSAALEAIDHEVEVVRWDERMTTSAAENLLISADVSRRRRKEVVDQIAAAHILQGYLDSLKR